MHRRTLALLARPIAALSVALGLAAPCLAEITLAPFLRDHAVLQRDLPIVIAGTADPEEPIEVVFGAATAVTQAGKSGTFTVTLPAQPADAAGRELVVRGKQSIVVHDILLGDVWLCSGQSNMEWSVGNLPDAAALVAQGGDPLIRFLKTPHALEWEPRDTADGTWTLAVGEAIKGCTAIGYHFAREMRDAQHVPIGILDLSWGGTKIEPWLPVEAVRRDIEVQGEYNAARNRVTKTEPPNQEAPTAMWNAMVAPFTSARIKGIAWYQGESNAYNPGRYRRTLPLMIDEWRKAFRNAQLPFCVFQLASFQQYRADLPVENNGWADLREAQRGGASEKGAGLVVLLDLGDPNDIHPARKAEAAHRLALWARATVFGESVEWSGPVFRSVAVRGGSLVLTFDHAKGLATRDGKPLGGFAIAGEDGVFVWADATIEGETVVVHSDKVAAPTTARYAWHNNPEAANLVNGAGLPAGPFRTDPAPEKKAKKR